MKKIIFATTNENKVREVRMMMKDFDIELTPEQIAEIERGSGCGPDEACNVPNLNV